MATSNIYHSCYLGNLLPDLNLGKNLADLSISGLSLDSRQVTPGDLFFAIPGNIGDGRDYIDSSLQSGARIVLYQSDKRLSFKNERVLPIVNLNQKISEISGRFYSYPSKKLSLTGITGTNGKTTCAQLLANLLSVISGPTGIIGTLGYGSVVANNIDLISKGMTTPDPITIQSVLADFVRNNIEQAVVEVSSHGISQYRIKSLSFDTAVFTNLTHDHLDYHGDLSNYSMAKKELFAMPGLKNAVINIDDPIGSEIARDLPLSVNKFSFSLDNPKANIYADKLEITTTGIKARINTPWGEGELNSRLLGKFNLQNLLAVCGAACCQGIDFLNVIKKLSVLENIPGRMELINKSEIMNNQKKISPTVIVDFAHTPDALRNVLKVLRENCEGKLWCVFGCGGNRDTEKRGIMGKIAAELADNLVITNDNPREECPEEIATQIFSGITSIKQFASPFTKIILDRREAINFSIKSAAKKDVILVAGKGNESLQFLGSGSLPFSDRIEAKLALEIREKGL